MNILTKLEEADVDGFNWNSWYEYEEEVVEELTRAFVASFTAVLPLPNDYVQQRAAVWARKRAIEQIELIADSIRERVRIVISTGVREGQSIQQISRAITGDWAFSPEKARMIARTETASALGNGMKDAAVEQGRDEKRWVTAGDFKVTSECQANEEQGWIGINDIFTSGIDMIPQHPNCRCVVRYRTGAAGAGVPLPPPEVRLQEEFRCSECKRLLGKDVGPGTRILCRHCKKERIAAHTI